jgi:hypothetical protein
MACMVVAVPMVECHLKVGKKNRTQKNVCQANILSNSVRPSTVGPAAPAHAGSHQKAAAAVPAKLQVVMENLASR